MGINNIVELNFMNLEFIFQFIKKYYSIYTPV
jgi:hypothetical protein